MMAITNLLMVGAALTMVAGQAPGDEEELCTVSLPNLGQNVVEDPPNGRILMDSSHYIRLLPPNSDPVWQEVDLDDNNPTGILASVSNSSDNNIISINCKETLAYFLLLCFSGRKQDLTVTLPSLCVAGRVGIRRTGSSLSTSAEQWMDIAYSMSPYRSNTSKPFALILR